MILGEILFAGVRGVELARSSSSPRNYVSRNFVSGNFGAFRSQPAK